MYSRKYGYWNTAHVFKFDSLEASECETPQNPLASTGLNGRTPQEGQIGRQALEDWGSVGRGGREGDSHGNQQLTSLDMQPIILWPLWRITGGGGALTAFMLSSWPSTQRGVKLLLRCSESGQAALLSRARWSHSTEALASLLCVLAASLALWWPPPSSLVVRCWFGAGLLQNPGRNRASHEPCLYRIKLSC